MLMISRFAALARSSQAVAALGFLAFTASAFSQFGVSPSQTSNYFDDFRARSSRMQQSGSGVRSGDVVYDYDSGAYIGVEGQEQMRPEDLLRESRQVSQPAVNSGSAAFSARAVGDYTNYSGQYTSPTGYFAPTYTSDPFLAGKRNVKLGPVNVGFGLYQGFEYNSNINRSSNNPISDIISTTMLNIDANYRITKNNVLSMSTGIGFDHYFSHPELAPYGNGNAVLNVLPGSTIAFDMKAGPLYFTVYDRVSVRPAVNNAFTLNGQSVFGVFTNDFGVVMNYALNSKWSLSLGVNNSMSTAMESRFSQFDRTINSIQGAITYSPHGTWSTGLEFSLSRLEYDQQLLNDGSMKNLGVFFRTNLGKSTYLKVAGGYQNFQFDNPILLAPPAVVDFNTDMEDYYFNLSISNQLNNRFSHTLSLGHESALNLTSNFVTASYINYGISMITSRGGRLSLSTYFEDATPSAIYLPPSPFASQGEVRQHGFDVYYSHQITSKIRMGTGYHYGRTDAKAPGNDFDQHAFNVDFNMALTAKSNVNFGYRYFTTDTVGVAQDFNQHRLILGFNYNF